MKAIIRRKPVLYCIAEAGTDFRKLGTTTNLERRLRQLQCGNPRKLTVLRTWPGGFEDEKALHQIFAAQRVDPDLEWFHHHPDMLTIGVDAVPAQTSSVWDALAVLLVLAILLWLWSDT